MNATLLHTVNLYAQGMKAVQQRRKDWLDKYNEVKEQLKAIAKDLNEQADYKPGFYVDTNHAFNEEINGSCADIPSLTFRCGEMPLHISFKTNSGEMRAYAEEGFHIVFTPTITGQVLVMLRPHHSSFSAERPQYANLLVLEEPGKITPEIIEAVIAKGIETAFFTSYTGFTTLQEREAVANHKTKQYAPIGFKRYESTQKV